MTGTAPVNPDDIGFPNSSDMNKVELLSATGNGRKMMESTIAKRTALAATQTETREVPLGQGLWHATTNGLRVSGRGEMHLPTTRLVKASWYAYAVYPLRTSIREICPFWRFWRADNTISYVLSMRPTGSNPTRASNHFLKVQEF